MKIQPGYIGWDRGLSLSWGRAIGMRGYVSLAWDRWIVMVTWGFVPRVEPDQNRPAQ